jgi:hypothetical protein
VFPRETVAAELPDAPAARLGDLAGSVQ